MPHVDALIDDGGHTLTLQKTTLDAMWPHLPPGGVYICEDLAYNYKDSRPTGSFIELVKGLVDRLQVCRYTRL